MMESTAHQYLFASFQIDARSVSLLHNGRPLTLTQKQFETLLFLIDKAGLLVTKAELMERIWPDTCVEPANLTQNIFVLRKLLALYEPNILFIETVPRRGYRFVAPVQRVKTNRKKISGPETGTSITRHEPRLNREVTAIAVLPFDCEGDESSEYLSYGIADSIVNNLSGLTDLRVMAHRTVSRCQFRTATPKEIGEQLGVRTLLTGKVLRLGDRVVVRTSLVNALTGWQIWGDQYEHSVSDLVLMQQEISKQISVALRHKLSKEEEKRVAKLFTASSEAYQSYLKGRYHWNKFDQISLRKAVDYFTRAITLDPSYALAYAGLADTYYRLSNVYSHTRQEMPKAKIAALKALEIDEDLTETHSTMGLIRMLYDFDWKLAEHEFRRAIHLNPNCALARQRFGLYFNLMGRPLEAFRQLEVALLNDPLSPQSHWTLALTLFLANEYEEALDEIQRTLEIDRSYLPALYLLARIHNELGQYMEAKSVFKELLRLSNSPLFVAGLGQAYARAGNRQEAKRVLADLESRRGHEYVSEYARAGIFIALGNKKQALRCLEKAYADRCEMVNWLKVDPTFKTIRSEALVVDLIEKIGFDRATVQSKNQRPQS